jgi:N,N'-diacetyllegionaminate synthase
VSVFIIAEAGVNHNGSFRTAIDLIHAAAKAGADAVKFQTYRADELTVAGPHRDMLAKYQMPLEWYPQLKAEANELKIEFMSSPFDIESARFLKNLGVKRLKIPSGELTNIEFLKDVTDLGLPLILSTGMATMEECIEAARATMGVPVSWLHCVTSYPAKIADYNLRCFGQFSEIEESIALYRHNGVGLSDHTIGDTLAVAAVAMGATVIEKHIALCFEDEGPDHAASMEPAEFAAMVRKIRDVESAMGDGVKRPTPEELLTMPRARRKHGPEGFKRYP